MIFFFFLFGGGVLPQGGLFRAGTKRHEEETKIPMCLVHWMHFHDFFFLFPSLSVTKTWLMGDNQGGFSG